MTPSRLLRRPRLALAAALVALGALASPARADWAHRMLEWRGRPLADAIRFITGTTPTHPVTLAFEWRADRREGVVLEQEPEPGDLARGQRIRLVVNQAPLSLRTARVPEVVGQTRDRAVRMIADAGLGHRVSGSGLTDESDVVQVVVRQVPAGGSRVRPGTSVAIDLEWRDRIHGRTGAEWRMVDVVGMHEDDAVARVRRAGFVPRVNGLQGEGRKVVESQSPPAGAPARPGSHVRLVLRFEHPAPLAEIRVTSVVPRVLGLERAAAEEALRRAGLRARFLASSGGVQTHVVAQSALAGTRVARNSQIRLSLGPPPPK